jgi:hypothetical protein
MIDWVIGSEANAPPPMGKSPFAGSKKRQIAKETDQMLS